MHTPADWWKKAFDKDYFDFLSELLPPARSKKEVRFAIKALNLKKNKIVLDAPCGYGRHSFFFGKNGIYTVGVDYSSFFIQRAKERCKDVSHYTEFHQIDLRNISYKNRFHAIVNFFSSFGYFKDRDNEKVLTIFYNALKKEGGLLLDLPNAPRLIKQIPTKEKFTTSSGSLCDEIAELDAEKMTALLRFTIMRGKKKRVVRGKLRLYTLPEIKRVLNKIGFKNISVAGAFSGKPYNPKSPRMIIIAKK